MYAYMRLFLVFYTVFLHIVYVRGRTCTRRAEAFFREADVFLSGRRPFSFGKPQAVYPDSYLQ